MRYCEHCGRELKDGEICTCQSQPSSGTKKSGQKISTLAVSVPKKIPGRFLIIAVVAVIVVAALIGAVVSMNSVTEIDLRDVVSVTYSGCDTQGVAEISADWEEINSSVLKKKTDRQAFEHQLEYTLDRTEGLSNGDELTLKVSYDPAVLEECRVRLRQDTLTFTVEGLEEMTILDFFADVKVTFEGTEPGGSAMVSNLSTDPFLQTVTYDISPVSDLSNGDTVVLTAVYDADEATSLRIAPQATEKTYTVEGLTTYVRNPSELNQEALADLDQECQDVITARIMGDPYSRYAELFYDFSGAMFDYFNRDKNTPIIDSMKPVGIYVACRKQIEEVDPENSFVGCIYQVDAHDGFQPGNRTFYYYVRFDSVLRESDGSIVIDYAEPNKETGREDMSADGIYRTMLAPYVENYTVTQLDTAASAQTQTAETAPEAG